MARDTAAIGADVVIGENTPPVETTVEALIRQYNRQPLNSSLSTGDLVYWDATAGAWVRVAGTKSAGQLPVAQADGTVAWGNGSSPTEFYIPAVQLGLRAGSPSFSQALHGGFGGWQMDASATEDVARSFKLPNDWSTFDVVLYWSNVGAGAGDVVWRTVRTVEAGNGETLIGAATVTAATITAPAQDVLKVSTLAAGIVSVDDKLLRLGIQRLATDAADTLANDASIIGVLMRKAS